jgi:hypothetical protein
MMNLSQGLMENKIAKRYVTHLLNPIKGSLVHASRRPEDDLDMSGM